jgi:hypothetical protein
MASRKRPVHHIGDLLPELASRLGLDKELEAARAISSWSRIVEELVPAAAGASRLLEVRPPALMVAADDGPTGQELRLHAAELLDAFAGAPGGRRLRELHVVVRPRENGETGKPR